MTAADKKPRLKAKIIFFGAESDTAIDEVVRKAINIESIRNIAHNPRSWPKPLITSIILKKINEHLSQDKILQTRNIWFKNEYDADFRNFSL